MMGLPEEPIGHEDPHIRALYDAAMASADQGGRAFLREFMALATDIEKDIRECRRLLRDCNVIAARMIDRLVRSNASGEAN